jgi:serine/threonine protein kinase
MRRRRGSGTVLAGRYRLDRLLGTGGMASVWLATDEKLERPVAVKLLSEPLATDPSFVARFVREAQLAARLSHPNLVHVYHLEGGERPYLVMEYVSGGTLASAVSADDGPDPRRVARELLAALSTVHGAGIVHRDVKPQNVLIDDDGRSRLTDFGIARPSDATSLTQTGEVLGTMRYMAPELREGRPPTPRSDLYSVGVLLEECFAESAPPDVLDLAARLSANDPRDRPASASEALRDLDDALRRQSTHEPTEPLPLSPAPETDVVPDEDSETERLPREAPVLARRRFVHVSPARALATAALLAAAIGAGALAAPLRGEGPPLLGPEAGRSFGPERSGDKVRPSRRKARPEADEAPAPLIP